MTPHEIDLRFAAEIARMKKLTIEKDRRDGRGFLAVAVAGLVAGIAAWWLGLVGPDRTFGDKIGVSAGDSARILPSVFLPWNSDDSIKSIHFEYRESFESVHRRSLWVVT